VGKVWTWSVAFVFSSRRLLLLLFIVLFVVAGQLWGIIVSYLSKAAWQI
jgi:hypothetical protein